ncbi:hypothetical protein [Tsukamurella sp. NPDC003166]|uniref:hypothetical protein n=1 Tax=Tsukamurella sp. NPDC003166 TaxID=3154444 RepID=UPI0033BE9543
MSASRYLLRPGVHAAVVPGRGVYFGGDARRFFLDVPPGVVELFRRHEPALLAGATEAELRAGAEQRGDRPETLLGLVRALARQDLVRSVSAVTAAAHDALAPFAERCPGIAAELRARHPWPEEEMTWLRDTARARIRGGAGPVGAVVVRTLTDCGIALDRIRTGPRTADGPDRIVVEVFDDAGARFGHGVADLAGDPVVVHGAPGADAGRAPARRARGRYLAERPNRGDEPERPGEPVRRAAGGLAAAAAVRAATGLEPRSLGLLTSAPLTLEKIDLTPPPATVEGLVEGHAAVRTDGGDPLLVPVRLADGADLPQLPHHCAAARPLDAARYALVGFGGEPAQAAVDALLAAYRRHAEHGAGEAGGHGYAGRTPGHARLDAYLRALPFPATEPVPYGGLDLPTRRLWLDAEHRGGVAPRIAAGEAAPGWFLAVFVPEAAAAPREGAYGRTPGEAVYCLLAAARLRALVVDGTRRYRVPSLSTTPVSALDPGTAGRAADVLAALPALAETELIPAQDDPLYGPTAVICGTVR